MFAVSIMTGMVGSRARRDASTSTPGHPWHLDVQDHHVGAGSRGQFERFAPSCRRLDDVAVPRALEVFADRVEERRIVVNDEDPDLPVCH